MEYAIILPLFPESACGYTEGAVGFSRGCYSCLKYLIKSGCLESLILKCRLSGGKGNFLLVI